MTIRSVSSLGAECHEQGHLVMGTSLTSTTECLEHDSRWWKFERTLRRCHTSNVAVGGLEARDDRPIQAAQLVIVRNVTAYHHHYC